MRSRSSPAPSRKVRSPKDLKPAGGAPFTNERSSTNQSGQMPDFGQANDPHRDSGHLRFRLNITSPTRCVFKLVLTTEYSRGGSRESFGDATSEVAILDFNKIRQFDIEGGDSPNVVIGGTGWICKQGGCQDIVKIGISAPRHEEARAVASKRQAVDFIKKTCPGVSR